MKVRAFMLKYKQSLEPNAQTRMFRIRLNNEEGAELITAIATNDRGQIIDGAADLLYVVYGLAEVYNFDLDEAFARVHESNMTKELESVHGKPIKGPSFKPPDLQDIIARSYEREEL